MFPPVIGQYWTWAWDSMAIIQQDAAKVWNAPLCRDSYKVKIWKMSVWAAFLGFTWLSLFLIMRVTDVWWITQPFTAGLRFWDSPTHLSRHRKDWQVPDGSRNGTAKLIDSLPSPWLPLPCKQVESNITVKETVYIYIYQCLHIVLYNILLLYYIISYYINYIAKAASGAGVVSPSNIVASGTQERYGMVAVVIWGTETHGFYPPNIGFSSFNVLKCAKCVFVALQIL